MKTYDLTRNEDRLNKLEHALEQFSELENTLASLGMGEVVREIAQIRISQIWNEFKFISEQN